MTTIIYSREDKRSIIASLTFRSAIEDAVYGRQPLTDEEIARGCSLDFLPFDIKELPMLVSPRQIIRIYRTGFNSGKLCLELPYEKLASRLKQRLINSGYGKIEYLNRIFGEPDRQLTEQEKREKREWFLFLESERNAVFRDEVEIFLGIL